MIKMDSTFEGYRADPLYGKRILNASSHVRQSGNKNEVKRCSNWQVVMNTAVRQVSSHPIKLDESIDSLQVLLDALAKQAMDVVCIKVSKVGGLTKAKQLRDICAAQNISMTVEDTWGSDIVTATISHLAASTPVKAMLNCSDLNRYMSRGVAVNAPEVEEGYLLVSDEIGLGIEPDWDFLGDPVFEYKNIT